MDGETVEVDDENAHGERHAHSPEDIAGDDGKNLMVRICENFGNNATC